MAGNALNELKNLDNELEKLDKGYQRLINRAQATENAMSDMATKVALVKTGLTQLVNSVAMFDSDKLKFDNALQGWTQLADKIKNDGVKDSLAQITIQAAQLAGVLGNFAKDNNFQQNAFDFKTKSGTHNLQQLPAKLFMDAGVFGKQELRESTVANDYIQKQLKEQIQLTSEKARIEREIYTLQQQPDRNREALLQMRVALSAYNRQLDAVYERLQMLQRAYPALVSANESLMRAQLAETRGKNATAKKNLEDKFVEEGIRKELAAEQELISLHNEKLRLMDAEAKAQRLLAKEQAKSNADTQVIDNITVALMGYQNMIQNVNTALNSMARLHRDIAQAQNDSFMTKEALKTAENAQKMQKVQDDIAKQQQKEAEAQQKAQQQAQNEAEKEALRLLKEKYKLITDISKNGVQKGKNNMLLSPEDANRENSILNKIIRKRKKMLAIVNQDYYRAKGAAGGTANERIAKEEDKQLKAYEDMLQQHRIQISKLKYQIAADAKNNKQMGVGEVLDFARNANTIEQYKQAMQELRRVMSSLDKTSADYKQQMKQLDNAYTAMQYKLRTATKDYNAFKTAVKNAQNVLSQFGIQLSAVFAVQKIYSVYKDIVKISGEFELQRKSLGAIIKNQIQANKLFEDLKDMAKESPYTALDLSKYAKQLGAYKVKVDELYDTVSTLSDISAGLGVDMERIILAYGQVKSANYLRGMELRQFSKAGVNLVAGLQEYYKETQNITYSMGQIFKMVSERKILFEDVEAVLKRMTEYGGEFYKKQLVQADTLYGKVQKLKDVYQQTLGEMGDSSRGLFVGVVGTLTFLAKNMQTILSIATNLTMAIIAQKAATALLGSTFVQNFRGATAAAKLMNASISEMHAKTIGLFTAIRIGLKGLGSLLKANAVFLIITAITTLVSVWRRHNEKVEAARKAVAELKSGYAKLRAELDDSEVTFTQIDDWEQQKAALENLIEKAHEYHIALTSLQDVKVDQSNIVDVYNAALKEFRETAADSEIARVWAETEEDFVESAEDFTQSYIALSKAMYSAEEHLQQAMENADKKRKEELRSSLNELHEYRKRGTEYLVEIGRTETEFMQHIIESEYIYHTAVVNSRNSIGELQEHADELMKVLGYTPEKMKEFSEMTTEEFKVVLSKWASTCRDMKKMSKEATASMATYFADLCNQNRSIVIDVIYNDKGHDPNFQYGYHEAYTNFLSENISEWKDAVDALEKTKENYKKTLYSSQHYVLEDVRTDAEKAADEARQSVTDFVFYMSKVIDTESARISQTYEQKKKNALDRLYNIGDEKSEEEARAELKKRYDKTMSLIKYIQNGMDNAIREKSSELADFTYLPGFDITDKNNVISTLQKYAEQVRTLQIALGFEDKSNNKGRAKSYKDEFDRMVRFIRKLHTETDKLGKTFDKTKNSQLGFISAIKQVKFSFLSEYQSMPKAFRDIFDVWEKEQVKLIEIDKNFDYSNPLHIIDALKQLEKLIGTGHFKKDADEMRQLLQKNIGEVQAEVQLKFKTDYDEQLSKQVDTAFEEYENYKQMRAWGVSTEDAGSLFGIKTRDLMSLQKKIASMREMFIGDSAVKKYNEYYNKLYKITQDANKKRLESYANYMRKEFTELTKLTLEYEKKLAEMRASVMFSDEQKRMMANNMKKEYDAKVNKQRWEDFQKGDYYQYIFDDLERVSYSTLSMMHGKLVELKSELSELPLEEQKQVLEAIQKIEKRMVEYAPITTIKLINKEMSNTIDELQNINDAEANKVLEKIIKKNGQAGLIRLRMEKDAMQAQTDAQEEKVKGIELELGRVKELQRAYEILKTAEDDAIFGAAITEIDFNGDTDLSNLFKFNIEVCKVQLHSYYTRMQELSKQIADEYNIELPEIDIERMTPESMQTYNDFIVQMKTTAQGNVDNLSAEMLNLMGDISRMQTIYDAGALWNTMADSIDTTSGSLNKLSQEYDENSHTLEEYKKIMGLLVSLMNNAENKRESFENIFENVVSMAKQTGDIVNDVAQDIEYFGGSFGDCSNSVKTLISDIVSLGQDMLDFTLDITKDADNIAMAFKSMGEGADHAFGTIVYIILKVLSLIIKLVEALGKFHDNMRSDAITVYKRHVDDLQRSIEKLSETLENAFDTQKMFRTLSAFEAKTLDEIDTLKKIRALEESKKKSDIDAINNYENQINDLYDSLSDKQQEFMTELGGFSASDVKSAAENFVDSWFDAFNETGSGLSELNKVFNDFLKNVVKKQILQRVMARFVEPLTDEINAMVADGIADESEFARIINRWNDYYMPQMNEAMRSLYNVFDAAGLNTGELTGLQKGIQGITEESANIIAAYLNSLRYLVSEQNQILGGLEILTNTNVNTNPMLSELRAISQNTDNIHRLLNAVTGNTTTTGGQRIKVYAQIV